jgi:DNA-binding LacI/PurR family transcriptional regulator
VARAKSVQSIYDLAEQTGVSASTVSRVLNGRYGIGDATRQKVLLAARAAGFRPRMTARNLTIALVIDRSQFASFGGFVSTLINDLVKVLSRHDVAVELITERSFSRLRGRLVDGVLAMAWDDATLDELLALPDIPVVTLNRMDAPSLSAVASDHRQQGEMAANFFQAHGHRRLAMISEERGNWGSQQRAEGFTAALKQHGLDINDECIQFTDHQPMYGVLRRLVAGWHPTGIFVAGEDMGLEASYIVRQVLGLKIPEDISLIGMESAKVSQFLFPPMTTLCQPMELLAEKAMEVLLAQISASEKAPVQVMLENTLIERESVLTLASD